MYKKLLLAAILLLCQDIFAENRMDADRNWKQLKTSHFNIFFPEGSGETALFAAKIAEDAYMHTSAVLNHDMTAVIPVIIYPSEIKFQQNNIIDGRIPEEVGGFTEFFKGRIAVPYSGDIPLFRHVLAHEIVHAFQYDILRSLNRSVFSFSMIPLWYIEGMAEFISSGYDQSADMFMRDIIINNLFIDLRSFNRNSYYTGYQAYKQGQSFFLYLSEIYGEQYISRIFTDAVAVEGFEKALEKNLDKKIFEINKEWFRFYSRKYDPLIGSRQFDDESGKQLKNHVLTRQFFNMHPSISPDGKRIAYITTADYAFKLTIAEYRDGKLENSIDADGGWYSSSTQYLNASSNRISWSADGRKIIYSVQSRDRKIIRIYDLDTHKKQDIILPFESIRSPSVDPDFKLMVFAAQQNNTLDLFVYDLEKKEIKRLTSDYFTERSPVFSKNRKFVYFASNRNSKNDFFSSKYSIFSVELASGKVYPVVESAADVDGLSFSDDGKTLLYSSDKNGINNIYSFNLETNTGRKHSDVLNGVFSPVMKRGRIYCSAYSFLGYDLMELDSEKVYDDSSETVSYRFEPEFPSAENHLADSFAVSDNRLYRDNLFFLLGGTVGYGVAGIAVGQFSDLYGDSRVQFSAEYLYFDEFEKEINFNAAYLFLKKKPDFYAGVFRQKNPFAFYSVDSFNDFFNNVYTDTLSIYRYGIYGGIEYPFSRFSSLALEMTSYRYERTYDDDSPNNDIRASLNQISAEFRTSNLIHAFFGPVDGHAFSMKFSETADIYNSEYNFQNIDVSADKYYNLDNILVFSFNFNSGMLFNGREDVLYSLGGYNSLRGYNYGEFAGMKYFLFTAETEFILLESVKFGLGSGIELNSLGFALFTDAGSAWSGDYSLKAGDRYDDLKIDYGYGFRMHVSQELYLKLDIAYGWDGEKSGNKKIQFSISMN